MSLLLNRCAAWVGVLLLIASSVDAAEFVRLGQNAQGSWHFVAKEQAFYSLGICHVAGRLESRDGQGRVYDGIKIRGGVAPWSTRTVKRLTDWGFNTAGAWCDESIYEQPIWHTRYVWLSAEVDGIPQRLLNVFSPGYESKIDELCAKYVAPHKDNPWLIGWFLDNELPWFGDFGWYTDPHRSLLDLALKLPASDPNRQTAIRFLRTEYGDFAHFAREWQTEAKSWDDLVARGSPRAQHKSTDQVKRRWAGQVAERFFTVCCAAVRKHDPNHLVLGARFAGSAPGPVVAACARHCDVVSINHYVKDGSVDAAWWDRLYAMVQKPLMVTEFSWRATENRSGNRNTQGADVTVPTQRDRAARYEQFVSQIMARPYILGMHWFEWADEPENGRFDGENCNYGLVDWQDEPYEELVTAAKKTSLALTPPDSRGGSLPAPADRDGAEWNAKALASLPVGKLAAPVELASKENAPQVSLDEHKGTQVSATRDADAWKIDFDSGTGWGFNVVWTAPQATSLVGAQSVRVRFDATAGTKFNIMFFERGDDHPPTHPTAGADGECWLTDLITAPAGAATMEFDLRELELNLYHGNQQGNRRLNLEDLRAVGLYFPSNQGRGTVRLSTLTLAE
jgi:hypothetical protein